MASKYLSSFSSDDYTALTKKLRNVQNHQCLICEEKIDLERNTTNIDHTGPLANKGKDSEDTFALTPENCTRSEQGTNLEIAKILQRLKLYSKRRSIRNKQIHVVRCIVDTHNFSFNGIRVPLLSDGASKEPS